MGVVSRKVLPVCGTLCICCPELRARSRQPVKRYKKLLSDIFPKSPRLPMILRWLKCIRQGGRDLQEEPPNDRKIGKLTEYASKNPLRIPKIAIALEQRGLKAVKSERFSSVRIVMRAYSMLMSTCRDQMPLYAISALTMIRVLLDQRRNDFLQVLGCMTLIDFLNNQTDSTYMRDLDEILPKLCALGRDTGEEQSRLPLLAAGLQGVASLLNFMGKYSHIPPDFDDLVAVVLENYEVPLPDVQADSQGSPGARHSWVDDVMKRDGRGPVAVMSRAISKFHSQKESTHGRNSSNLTRTETDPKVWSQICIQNMARLAKEATTMKRVLEPMFRYFDAGGHWPPDKLAVTVLRDMQYFMNTSGNEQLSLSVLVRHLDHKDVANDPALKTDIVEVLILLARQSKPKSTGIVAGAISDLFRHLRKSMQASLDSSKPMKCEAQNIQKGLQQSLELCLVELAKRVGDATPLIDMMAATLENLPANPANARITTEAVYVLATCLAYVPDQSFGEQVFPEVLFQELLQAMVHPDVETRVRTHHIFALLLVPLSLVSKSDDVEGLPNRPDSSSRLLRSSSAFCSAAALFEKLKRQKSGLGEQDSRLERNGGLEHSKESAEGIELTEIVGTRRQTSVGSLSSSQNGHESPVKDLGQEPGSLENSGVGIKMPSDKRKDLGVGMVRLNGHQASLLLSTLWLQATLPDNVPASYEAIANTYILTLYFSRAKTSNHRTAIRAFQLALSLRNLAIDVSGGQLPPSRRRSLFTLSAAMLVFAGRAYNVPQLGAVAKTSLTSATKDPYLELSDDIRLKIVNSSAGYVNVKDYGSAADDRDAFKSFSGMSISQEQSAEALAAMIVGSSTVLGPEDFAVADQMLQPFSAAEAYDAGSQFYFETPRSRGSPLNARDSVSFDEVAHQANTALEDDVVSDTSAVELPRLLANFRVPPMAPHAMGASQLLESALVTASQVACTSTNGQLSYNALASKCENFRADSRKRISSVLKLDCEYDQSRQAFPERDRQLHTSPQHQQQPAPFNEVFRLPPASPYDNFLKAAGC